MIVDEADRAVAHVEKIHLVLGLLGEVGLVVVAVEKVDLVLGSADEVDLILLIVDKIASLLQLWTRSTHCWGRCQG